MTAPTALTRRATTDAAQPGRHWQQDAACRDEDPDLFHPAGKTGIYLKQIKTAKAVCRGCPVKQRCLDWAIANREMNGIYGGMDEDERRRLLRRSRRWVAGNPERAWVQILRDRRPEFLALEAAGASVSEIARAMGTNFQTVYNVRRALEEDQLASAAPKGVAA